MNDDGKVLLEILATDGDALTRATCSILRQADDEGIIHDDADSFVAHTRHSYTEVKRAFDMLEGGGFIKQVDGGYKLTDKIDIKCNLTAEQLMEVEKIGVLASELKSYKKFLRRDIW